MYRNITVTMSNNEARKIRKALACKMARLEDQDKDSTEEYAEYESLYKWFVELTKEEQP